MSLAYKFPEAFETGFAHCKMHYELVAAGERKEIDAPPHPYRDFDFLGIPQHRTEWHAYNAGWFQAIPGDENAL